MTIASSLVDLIGAVDANRAATLVTAAVGALAAYGAALVALRVGRGARVVLAREKGPLVTIDDLALSSDRATIRLRIGNAGPTAARWLRFRASVDDGCSVSMHVPVLLAAESRALRLRVPAGAGPVICRIDVRYRGLDDGTCRDRRVIVFDNPRAVPIEEPRSSFWLVRLADLLLLRR